MQCASSHNKDAIVILKASLQTTISLMETIVGECMALGNKVLLWKKKKIEMHINKAKPSLI